jgi:membrane-bound lytic murein transglycosylase D
MFKRDFVPAYSESYTLLIPATKKEVLSKVKDSLYKLFPADNQHDAVFVLNTDPEAKTRYSTKIYTVKRAETLSRIAAKNHVTIAQIKKWNNLKKNTLLVGQKLKIRKEIAQPVYVAQAKKQDAPGGKIEQTVTNDEVEIVKIPVTKVHTVKRGENMSLIASKHHVNIADIKNWNNLKSTKLMAGQKLKIKKMEDKMIVKKSSAEKAESIAANTKNSSGTEKVVLYKVEAGDTLYSIAKRYEGITVEKLLEMNGMKNSDALKAGMLLKIPSKG